MYIITWITFLCALLVAALAVDNKWKNVDTNALEKEWEQGDGEVELENEYDYIEKIAKKKQPVFNPQDPKAFAKAAKKGGGFGDTKGTTIFVFVRKTDEKTKKARQKNDYQTLAKKWDGMMKSGGLPIDVHQANDNVMMFVINKGWLTKDASKFCAMQPEIESFSVGNKQYTSEEYLAQEAARGDLEGEEDDDDDEL